MNNEEIMLKLQDHYNYVDSLGYEVLGVFLQGSQNYELEYDGSDIDSKTIVVPSLKDVALNKKTVSTTLKMENGEQIDLKDIREMFKCFKKQNINYIEILFTNYMIINHKYKSLFEPMLKNKEKIARYDYRASLNCMAGMVKEKEKALEHPYPATKHKIDKYGYDGKQLHHILRISEFMKRYIDGEDYEDCLVSKNKDELIKLKRDNHYSLEKARELAKKHSKKTYQMKNDYLDNNTTKQNKEVNVLMEQALVDILTARFCEKDSSSMGENEVYYWTLQHGRQLLVCKIDLKKSMVYYWTLQHGRQRLVCEMKLEESMWRQILTQIKHDVN